LEKGFKAYIYYYDFPQKIRDLIHPEKLDLSPSKSSEVHVQDFGEYSEKNTNSNILELGVINALNRTKADHVRDNTMARDDEHGNSQNIEEEKLDESNESSGSHNNLSGTVSFLF
jgi:hypothetical protein